MYLWLKQFSSNKISLVVFYLKVLGILTMLELTFFIFVIYGNKIILKYKCKLYIIIYYIVCVIIIYRYIKKPINFCYLVNFYLFYNNNFY